MSEVIIPPAPAPLGENATPEARRDYYYAVGVYNHALALVEGKALQKAQIATLEAQEGLARKQEKAYYPTEEIFIERTQAIIAEATANSALAQAIEKGAASQKLAAENLLKPAPVDASEKIANLAVTLMAAGKPAGAAVVEAVELWNRVNFFRKEA